MKKYRLTDLVPPWVDGAKHRSLLTAGLLFSAIVSCIAFAFRMLVAWTWIHEWDPITQANRLIPDVKMIDFLSLMQNDYGLTLGLPIFSGVTLMAAAAVILAVTYYAGHWQGSRSVYLMRRLPDRLEFHRRCLVLPLLTLLACVLLTFLLTLAFFGIYLFLTPEGYLPPNQWAKFWPHYMDLFLPLALF